MMNGHHIYQRYCPKKGKMFGDDVITEAEGGQGDNVEGHQRTSLASLAGITLQGHFLNIVSTIQNSQICSG